MAISFIQNNGHKSKAASVNLAEVLRSSNMPTVALVQEPYIFRDRPRNLGKLNVNFPGPNARTLIAATNDTAVWFRQAFSARDMTTAIIKTQTKEVFVASLYLDINYTNDDFFPPPLTSLLDYCTQKKLPLVIAVDSNAHSVLWGNESNARGRLIEELIIKYGLIILFCSKIIVS